MVDLSDFFDIHKVVAVIFLSVKLPRGGGGVLSYVTLTGTCGPIGYGFQGVLS